METRLFNSQENKISKKLSARFLALIFASFFLMSSMEAQDLGSVEGKVTDAETYKPIEAATVELLKTADSSLVTGLITDANGVYKFNDVPYGDYVIRASFLGYRRKVMQSFKVTPEKKDLKFTQLPMVQSSKKLDEVSVHARMLTGTMEDDKTVYVITKESAEIAASGLELLRQVPDCHVDFRTNAVTLEGSGNILFMVNGKMVDKDYLMQLNPNLIEKYEIMTNPGVKYDADVDGVINVVLKRNINYGLSARANVEIPTAAINYVSNSSFNIDYFKKGFRLYVGGNYGMNRFDIKFENERNTFGDVETSLLNRYTSGIEQNMYGGVNYGFDWFINDKTTLNFNSSIRPRFPKDVTFDTDILIDSVDMFNQNRTARSNFFNDYSLYYQRKFDKPGHDISTEVYFSRNNNNNENKNYNNVQPNEESITSNQLTDKNKNIIRFKIDYSIPLTEKIKFSAGAVNVNTLMNNEFEDRLADFSSDIDYTETRWGAYTNLAYKVKKHNLRAGVRYEYSNIDILYTSDTSNTYGRFLPFVSYQTSVGKRHTFRINYRNSINRPGLYQVDPFNFRDDSYSSSQGNPNIGPANIHKLELTHRIKLVGPLFVNYKPYFRYVNDGIQRITVIEDSVLVSKFNNVSSFYEYGVSFNGSLALSKWWMIRPGFTWYRKHINAMDEYGYDGLTANSYRLNLSSQFILPKDWVIFLEYNKQGPNYNHQTKRETNYVAVGGFYKKINKHWDVTMYVINPWDNKFVFEKTEKRSPDFTNFSKGYVRYDYVVGFRIGYSFNQGKEIKKVKRNIEQDSDAKGGSSIF
ncbi:MAG: outer membrane beta-barrel protein [Bacteroidales bacterium]|nr:outer membrane beta-barrel protein [Bacteroidales bacterium]